MSPEQVLGDLEEIDTRSDVYALGVILYELLAGKGPYEISRQIHETVRTIREQEPSALRVINRTFRGDIETIVGKALEKDKTRRYGSAADLAADIRRYLHDDPIVARPPSTSYRLQKFARRHKALVAAAAAMFGVLVAGIIASSREAVVARGGATDRGQGSGFGQCGGQFPGERFADAGQREEAIRR
jgi:serine/threonine protein kinase